ncbi:MAG: glycosyltransferase family 2 protein [Deltaproteobacteria bacterium]|nr:glycosyltransferase family 2 protein [Deltaproteobacteria bacterium]
MTDPLQDVSVIIITHDEERNIADCLDSVKWAGEVLVVDSHSADRTLELCRQRGAKVYVETWKGYAAQKNSALDKAEKTWVLSLDADERVTPELVEEIREVLHRSNSMDGYSIPRKNHFAGHWIRHGGWYPDRTLRFFRRNRGRFEERAVHEKVVIQGKTSDLQNPILHYTYRDISDFLRRSDRYSSLSAREYATRRITGPLRMLGHAMYTFLDMYVFKLGFLDGYYGFLLACLYSHYTFAKYAKLKELTIESPGS